MLGDQNHGGKWSVDLFHEIFPLTPVGISPYYKKRVKTSHGLYLSRRAMTCRLFYSGGIRLVLIFIIIIVYYPPFPCIHKVRKYSVLDNWGNGYCAEYSLKNNINLTVKGRGVVL